MRDGTDIADIADELFEPGCIIVATIVVSAMSLVMWYMSLKAPGSKSAQSPAHVNNDKQVPTDKSARGGRDALAWLAALVVTSLLLLIVQLALGFATGALTLIADSAHTAADTISYAFSWFVERAKCSAGAMQSERAQRAAARFDAFSAIFSVVIVLGTSLCATADAVRRLRSTGSESSTAAQDEDLGLIGPALLGFAVLSTAANCGLLALHRRRKLAKAVPSAAVTASIPPPPPPFSSDSVPPPPLPLQLDDSVMVRPSRNRERGARRNAQIPLLHQASVTASIPAPPPPFSSDSVPPPPLPLQLDDSVMASRNRERTARRNARIASGAASISAPPPPFSSDSVPPPPSPLQHDNSPKAELDDSDEFSCMPCLPPPLPEAKEVMQTRAADRPSRNRERAARRKAQIAWLHQAFHPSCNDANCSVEHSTEPPANQDGEFNGAVAKTGDIAADVDEQSNLNLYGAVLHLATDVLRSLVILVVALLVELGIIRDAPSADAICAIAVSICIVVGSVALLREAAAGLWKLRDQSQSAGTVHLAHEV